jgi:ureidoacrylate peracid hydrolase
MTMPTATMSGGAHLVVKDATADYSDEAMHAALDVNLPNYASAIVTTSQVVDSLRPNLQESATRERGW